MRGRIFSGVILVSLCFLVSCRKDEHKIDLSIDSVTSNNLIKNVIEEIRNNYADEVTREKLEEGAINGMLAFLDDHSMYINQSDFEAFNNSTRGCFLGIGVEIKQVKDGIEIVAIIDESPASSAGLRIGDIITSIDGKEVNTLSMKDIISKLSSDSALKIKIAGTRSKNERFDIELKKSVIQIKSVKLSFIEDIAVIRINHFNENTVVEVTSAIKKILKKEPKAVIVDVRNNPGGILDQAISVCDLFLDHGRIVEFQSRNSDESKIVYSDDIDLLNGLPMAVVIDSHTASGAELFAAALGENKRAIIIGEKSFGKGSLQTIIPIPGRGAIKLTTAYFISPNGNKINQNGVTPDIEIQTDKMQEVSQEDNIDPVIQRSIDLLHGISALNAIKEQVETK